MELLKKALAKAEQQAKTPSLETQITHADQFIERAKKRVAGADEKIRKAAAMRQRGGEDRGHPSNCGRRGTSGASQSLIGSTSRTAHSRERSGHGS